MQDGCLRRAQKNHWRGAAAILATLSLSACAEHPIPRAQRVDTKLTSADVLAHPRATHGARVRWGGMIISDRVGTIHSTLTILGYPLNGRGHPSLRRMPIGRFQAVAPGYLDPVLFAQGRLVTIVGTVGDIHVGHVGLASYPYPRLQIIATHVWRYRRLRRRSHWNFGLGIGVGL